MPKAKKVSDAPVKKKAKTQNNSLLNEEVKTILNFVEKRLKVFARKTLIEYKRK